jgi:uncharacterized protein YdaU (DUF1376 family)
MSLPYYPMYPRDFSHDTHHLPVAQIGAYIRLMNESWGCPGGTLPHDFKWIMSRVHATIDEWDATYVPVLEKFFTVDENGRIVNKRLKEEWNKADAKYRAQVSAGHATQKKLNPLKNNETPPQLTYHAKQGEKKKQKQNQNQNHKSTFGGKDATLPPEASGRRRSKNKGTTLPENWRLSYDDVERIANKHRVAEEMVRLVEGEFKAYWLSRAVEDEKNATKVSWERTFENDIQRKLVLGIIKHRSY